MTSDDSVAKESLSALLEVMRRLRDPHSGCPWDLQQSFETIAPYTLEEAFEVADAIERKDLNALRDELGDLLFQVVFHARLAEELGRFSFADVSNGIVEKLQRRHPHVFAAGERADWEALKAAERRSAGGQGALAGVALALPALARAAKLGKRAARVRFDWNSAAEVRDKVDEELAELDAAVAAGESVERVAEELGDTLFALTQWSRHAGVDPELALRAANAKFTRRFAAMEQLAVLRGWAIDGLSPAQWERLWLDVKTAEASSQSP
jgi:MazG family protein